MRRKSVVNRGSKAPRVTPRKLICSAPRSSDRLEDFNGKPARMKTAVIAVHPALPTTIAFNALSLSFLRDYSSLFMGFPP